MIHTRRKWLLGAIAATLLTACDDATAPSPGSLEISITTLGGDLDEDGYLLIIGAERQLPVHRNASILLHDIRAGTHVLLLEGVAANCALEGTQSPSITVGSGEVARVALTVTCETTGIEVLTSTIGPDQPFNGYMVTSGDRSATVSATGAAIVSRLSPGSRTVSLSVPENCAVNGGNVRTVNVLNRAVILVPFMIYCVRTEKRIAFVQDTILGGGYPPTLILVADANGSSVLPLVQGHGPAWSPDGRRIVFSTAYCDSYYYDYCSGGLAIIDPETRNTSVLGNGSSGFDPSWSPDGNLIAFSWISGRFAEVALLHLARLDGSPAVHLPAPMNARHPSWSPDGGRIVFECYAAVSSGQAQYDICAINRDGTGFVQLTNDGAIDRSPAWSPDGTSIAFATTRFGGGFQVTLMTPNGTGVTALTTGYDPAWSTDGSTMIVSRGDGLFSIRSDGSNLTRITTGQHRDPALRP